MGKTKRSPVWDDPRVKPPYGSVEIDGGHPRRQGLRFLSIFNETAGPPNRLDKPGQPSSYTGITWQPSASPRHRLELDGSSTAELTFPFAPADMPAIPFSVVLGLRWTTTANLVVAEINTNTGWSIQTFSNPILLMAIGGGSFLDLGTFAANDGIPHVIVFSVVSSTEGFVYVDGINRTAGQPNSAPNYGAATTLALFDRPGVGVNYTDQMFFFGLLGRAVSQPEAIEWTYDTYAVLRPIIRRRYFVPAAEAAAASAVRRRLTLLGVGS